MSQVMSDDACGRACTVFTFGREKYKLGVDRKAALVDTLRISCMINHKVLSVQCLGL